MRKAPTDITIYVQLDFGVIGPYNRVHGLREVLDEYPEAQKSKPDVPATTGKAYHQY